MRLWSLHPKYLDAKGLVALWREGLLAKAVLEGRTRGYRAHPQLVRFRKTANPINSINAYLHAVLEEAQKRGYRFDANKLGPAFKVAPIKVTAGQLQYEWGHLLSKLKRRAPKLFRSLQRIAQPEPHPLLKVVPGDVEAWEATKTQS